MSDENEVVDEQPVADSNESQESSDEGQVIESSEESSDDSDGVQATTQDELKEEVTDAIAQGATEAEVKAMIKDFTLKVNGKEFTKTLDLSDEDAVRKELQLAAAGRQAMQKSSDLEKLYKDQVGGWKSNPWKFFEDLGMDPDDIVSMRVQEQLREMEKPAEQIEREKWQKELEEARNRERSHADELANMKKEIAFEQASQQLDDEITKAIDAHASLPATPRVIKQIADTMLWAYDNAEELGINPDDLKVEDVLPTVEKEIRKDFSNLMDSLGDEALEMFLGQRTMERLRKQRVNAATKVPSVSSVKAQETAKIKEKLDEKPKKQMSLEDFMRMR